MMDDLFLDDDTADGLYFQYCGYFSQDVIKSSVSVLDQRTRVDDVAPPVRRRLLNAFIEVSQNIVHYSHDTLTGPEARDGEVRFGSIEITAADGGFSIHSSNPVSETEAEALQALMGKLVMLDQGALKERYQAALRAEGEPGSKGGGIGFVRLAREASRQLQFSFVDAPINPDIKIFNLVVTVE